METTTVPARSREDVDQPPSHPSGDRTLLSPGGGYAADVANAGRGFLMGGADVIPGVSGGTVALILGIYERLVTAISRFDLDFVGHLRKRDWRAAAAHVDLRFLVTLGAGIVLGVGGLASLMHHLLQEHPQPTYAAFFGLILASSVLVARLVERWSPAAIALLVGGAAFAFWLVGLVPAGTSANPVYVFACGAVAICAMILPGISGAFILVILGQYVYVTGLVKDLVRGHVSLGAIGTLAVFGTGCAVGLLAFSKLLKWLLARHGSPTMALLCGFMIGSLRKIWPFKADDPNAPVSEKVDFRPNTWPAEFGSGEWLCVGLAVLGVAVVFALHRFGGGDRVTTHELDSVPDPSEG